MNNLLSSLINKNIELNLNLKNTVSFLRGKNIKSALKSKLTDGFANEQHDHILFSNLPFDLNAGFTFQASKQDFKDTDDIYLLALVPKENKSQVVLKLVSGELDQKIYHLQTKKLENGDRMVSCNFLPDIELAQGENESGASKIAEFLNKLPHGKNKIKVTITYNGKGQDFSCQITFNKTRSRDFIENASLFNKLLNQRNDLENLKHLKLPIEFQSNGGEIEGISRAEIIQKFRNKYYEVDEVLGVSISKDPDIKEWYICRNNLSNEIINMNSKAINIVFRKEGGKYYFRSYVLVKEYLGGGNYDSIKIEPLAPLGFDKEILKENIFFNQELKA